MENTRITEREKVALADIVKHRGTYSIFWTPKTREKLQSRGYVVVQAAYVVATKAGHDAAASNAKSSGGESEA